MLISRFLDSLATQSPCLVRFDTSDPLVPFSVSGFNAKAATKKSMFSGDMRWIDMGYHGGLYISGWWFGTFVFFHILGRIIPIDCHIF